MQDKCFTCTITLAPMVVLSEGRYRLEMYRRGMSEVFDLDEDYIGRGRENKYKIMTDIFDALLCVG